MHLSLLVAALAAAGPAAAWPGMAPDGSHAAHARFHTGDMARDLQRHADALAAAAAADVAAVDASASTTSKARRLAGPVADGQALLGDLQHLREDQLTDVGRKIKRMLTGELAAADVGAEAQAIGQRERRERQEWKAREKRHAEALKRDGPGPGCKPKTPKTTTTTAAASSSTPSAASSTSPTVSSSSPATTSSIPSASVSSTTSSTTSSTSSSVSSSSPTSAAASSSTTASSSSTTSTSSSATSTSTSASSSTTSTTSSTTSTTSSTTASSATAKPTIPPCSVWADLADELVPLFRDSSSSGGGGGGGRGGPGGGGAGCNSLARGCIRLGFHDAGAWNTTVPYGGADGSIALNADELARADNDGLAATVAQVQAWHATWNAKAGVGMADLIQFAAIVATAVCPLGPRVPFYAGRVDDARAAVPGLLPTAFDAAPDLVALFAAKTLSADDLVALVGAHSTSEQFVTDATTAGASQDTTPGVWDVLFYDQTAAADAPPGVYRFPSDLALAAYDETAATWQQFGGRGQRAWDRAYVDAYFRLSLLGVNNINDLLDCSSTIP